MEAALSQQLKSGALRANTSTAADEMRELVLPPMQLRTARGLSLQRLPSLQLLSLPFNELTSLDGVTCCTSLRVLNVSHNQLRDLAGIASLASLRVLRAQHNNIESLAALNASTAKVAKPTPSLQLLEELWLGSNRLPAVELRHLGVLRALRRLTLSPNPACAGLLSGTLEGSGGGVNVASSAAKGAQPKPGLPVAPPRKRRGVGAGTALPVNELAMALQRLLSGRVSLTMLDGRALKQSPVQMHAQAPAPARAPVPALVPAPVPAPVPLQVQAPSQAPSQTQRQELSQTLTQAPSQMPARAEVRAAESPQALPCAPASPEPPASAPVQAQVQAVPPAGFFDDDAPPPTACVGELNDDSGNTIVRPELADSASAATVPSPSVLAAVTTASSANEAGPDSRHQVEPELEPTPFPPELEAELPQGAGSPLMPQTLQAVSPVAAAEAEMHAAGETSGRTSLLDGIAAAMAQLPSFGEAHAEATHPTGRAPRKVRTKKQGQTAATSSRSRRRTAAARAATGTDTGSDTSSNAKAASRTVGGSRDQAQGPASTRASTRVRRALAETVALDTQLNARGVAECPSPSTGDAGGAAPKCAAACSSSATTVAGSWAARAATESAAFASFDAEDGGGGGGCQSSGGGSEVKYRVAYANSATEAVSVHADGSACAKWPPGNTAVVVSTTVAAGGRGRAGPEGAGGVGSGPTLISKRRDGSVAASIDTAGRGALHWPSGRSMVVLCDGAAGHAYDATGNLLCTWNAGSAIVLEAVLTAPAQLKLSVDGRAFRARSPPVTRLSHGAPKESARDALACRIVASDARAEAGEEARHGTDRAQQHLELFFRCREVQHRFVWGRNRPAPMMLVTESAAGDPGAPSLAAPIQAQAPETGALRDAFGRVDKDAERRQVQARAKAEAQAAAAPTTHHGLRERIRMATSGLVL